MKVTLLMAQTLDGKIAKDADHFPDWTGPEDKKLFIKRTKQAGCLIMGSKTYDTIGKPLPGRKNIVMTRKETSLSGNSYQLSAIQNDGETGLIYTNAKPQEILEVLENAGFEEVILAGGAVINTFFARENLIDEIVVTISPFIFGEGIAMFDESISLELQLDYLEPISKEVICVAYKVKEPQ